MLTIVIRLRIETQYDHNMNTNVGVSEREGSKRQSSAKLQIMAEIFRVKADQECFLMQQVQKSCDWTFWNMREKNTVYLISRSFKRMSGK